ncbi:hypothetical protein KI387_025165, partial [Taxus chinensis]
PTSFVMAGISTRGQEKGQATPGMTPNKEDMASDSTGLGVSEVVIQLQKRVNNA